MKRLNDNREFVYNVALHLRSTKRKLTTSHLGTKAEKQQPKIVKCCVEKITEEKVENKKRHTTLAIRNAGESADMKAITINKLTANRKVKCLEIPHYA